LNLDDSTYPDNNITWLKDLESLSHSALDWNHYMKIRAPFVNMTKKEIIDVGVYIGSPFDYQISCYYPVWDEKSQSYINCGKCGCDKLREYSFKGANYKDPVRYANPEINFDEFRSLPNIWSQNRKEKLLDKDDIPYFRYLYL
jgi:7-cyano-7-deazaguanine synthase